MHYKGIIQLKIAPAFKAEARKVVPPAPPPVSPQWDQRLRQAGAPAAQPQRDRQGQPRHGSHSL